LKRLGKVLHLSNSKKLVLRTKIKLKIGTKVLSSKRKPIGTVFDIFGQVRNPYLSIKPSISDPDHYIDQVLYIQKNAQK
jgi:RNA-binding protein